MHEVFEKIIESLDKSSDHYECEEQGREDVYMVDLEKAIEVVKEVAAEYNNGWIPCSERLPTMHECQENDCRFIVTDGNRRYQDWFDYEDNYFDRCSCDGRGLKKDDCVIAWQPLPQPYEPKED